jgi:uncharacterized protein YbjT (DUF2867 family)
MVILVTGGTGTQGGAVARRLLCDGHEVRVLVRDPAALAARDIEALGAVLVRGSFDDDEALQAAATGAQAVFSMQPAPQADPDSERNEARALVAAARNAGVDHFIHTSVSNTGSFRSMAGWQEGRWARNYWESKADAEAIAVDAGLRHLTILRPAFMMENFIPPKAGAMFPDLANGEIVTAVEPDSAIALVAADDIAAAAAIAIGDPGRFAGEPIELAGDWLTLPEIAEILSRTGFGKVTARTMSRAELIERGQFAGWVETQEWMNVVGYPARPEAMLRRGLEPTGFAVWVQRHAKMIGHGLRAPG